MVIKLVPLTDWEKFQNRWKHLAGLPLRVSGGQVDNPLGLDYVHLIAAIETRIGEENEPVATKTRLGWIVRGVVGVDVKPISARVDLALSTMEVRDFGSLLADTMRNFCETETFGTEYQAECLSPDDRRAIELLDAETKKLSVGYFDLLLLRRFVGLYGKLKRIYSDNGTNFVGADRELREAVKALQESEGVHRFLQHEGID